MRKVVLGDIEKVKKRLSSCSTAAFDSSVQLQHVAVHESRGSQGEQESERLEVMRGKRNERGREKKGTHTERGRM